MLKREKSVKKLFNRPPPPKESIEPAPTPAPTPVPAPAPVPEPVEDHVDNGVVNIRKLRSDVEELKTLVQNYIQKTDERFDKLAHLLAGRNA
jgi:hypothetical protein